MFCEVVSSSFRELFRQNQMSTCQGPELVTPAFWVRLITSSFPRSPGSLLSPGGAGRQPRHLPSSRKKQRRTRHQARSLCKKPSHLTLPATPQCRTEVPVLQMGEPRLRESLWLENNPEIPPSSRDEGLRLLHGLATNLATSLQTPQEA